MLQENQRRLHAMRDPAGRPWRIVELPTPGRIEHEGQRLPASYANFYIANGIVILPGFRSSQRREGAGDFAASLSGRGAWWSSPALDLIWGLGAFHCITQQQPAA